MLLLNPSKTTCGRKAERPRRASGRCWTGSSDERRMDAECCCEREGALVNTSSRSNRDPKLPAGATFRRCALQVNPLSYGRYRGKKVAGDAAAHARSIVEKSVQLGIDVLAITDHDDASGVPAFRAAAKGTSICIFPGFEIASSEGIHVLCIYASDESQERLNQHLGAFQIADGLSRFRFVEVLTTVREQGGVAVAAHAVSDNGLFDVLDGRARVAAWRCEDLLAIQIPKNIDQLPVHVREIVRNEQPGYRRPFRTDNQAVAVVNAMDVVTADDLADPAATCLIKMSDVTVESLRQAFLDPASRIRLNSDPALEHHTKFLSMRWDGGFLDGTEFLFNENLNVLVGGRGAGKSTVIESLRYVLDLKPVGADAEQAHKGIVHEVLRPGTKVTLRVFSHHANPAIYRIERIVPNPPVVRLADGQVSNLHPDQVLSGVEVYGQTEISEIARNPGIALLARFMAKDSSGPSRKGRKSHLRRSLEGNRLAIIEASKELADIDEHLGSLPGLEEMLNRYREAGLEERLRERSLVVREEALLNSVPERLEPFGEALLQLRQSLPIDRTFLSERALDGLPGADLIRPLDGAVKRLGERLAAIVAELEAALRDTDAEVAKARTNWTTRKDAIEEAYQSILRDLKQSAVDGQAFIQLREDIERLRPLRTRQVALQRVHGEHIAQRQALLAEWEELQAKDGLRLERAAQKVSQRLRAHVRVEARIAADRAPLFQFLREHIGGQLKDTLEKLANVPDLSLREFAAKCRDGAAALQKAYGLTPIQAHRIADADNALFMQIEELELGPEVPISLNVASADGADWKNLQSLSKGQKATAVLLLLLLESDAPLVIDQPEDDLDNRFITESVVPRMREEKRNRQFVFSTHNANIPVLGDAEMILGMTASGEAAEGRGRVPVEHMGSIDAPKVRQVVEELLEGGRDAFERRRRRYGF